MATVRAPARALFTLGAAVLVLSGCNKVAGGGDTEAADFARAALEHNDRITIVAFDKNENTFTIRMKDTGELRVVHADQVVGGIPGTAGSEGKTQPVSDETPPNGETTTSTPRVEAEQTASNGEVARPDATPPPAQSSQPTGSGVITDPRTGSVLASAGSATASEPTEGAAATPAGSTSASGKKVLASGPGYTITAGDRAPASAVRLASRSSDIPSPARGVAIEKRSEPMICQGQRLMHLDGRNLEFDGDALSVEDGCEIHITNSHIIAHGGIGLSVRAANVHIQNSVIEGDSGSVSASAGSQIYTQQSTFKGLSRRLDTATFHDLGGTVWNN